MTIEIEDGDFAEGDVRGIHMLSFTHASIHKCCMAHRAFSMRHHEPATCATFARKEVTSPAPLWQTRTLGAERAETRIYMQMCKYSSLL